MKDIMLRIVGRQIDRNDEVSGRNRGIYDGR